MAKVYKQSDRKIIKIDDLTVTVGPLSKDNKEKAIAMLTEGQKTQSINLLNEAIFFTLRACVKKLEGAMDADDNPYQLAFENGLMTEECLQDLTNMESSAKLLAVCGILLHDFTATKFEMKGVEVIKK